MKYFCLSFLLICLCSCKTLQNAKPEKPILDKKYANVVESLIGFFDKHAYDASAGVYFSEVDNHGKLVSRKVYIVALSRLIYGLAYTARYYPENLEKAQKATDFILKNLIGQDEHGGYFISSIENGQTDKAKTLDIWQQSYGLCGMTELYRLTGDVALLTKIRALHQSFVKRFQDKQNGGFYGNYVIAKGPVSGSKSIQTLIYPVSVYLMTLWQKDTEHRDEYESIMRANLALAEKVAWDEKRQWANLQFSDQWKVCQSEDASTPCFNVLPGFNFQLASLFLKASRWTFLTEEKKTRYKNLGYEIIDASLAKNIYPNKSIANGFVREVNPLNDEIIDSRKSWWQHGEALTALALSGERYNKEIELLETFFLTRFMDNTYGGEYLFIEENNTPVSSELKGNMGKSVFHTIDMIRTLVEN